VKVCVHLPEDAKQKELLQTHGLAFEGGCWRARMCAVRVRALRKQLGPDVRMDPPADVEPATR
jgi:hypothetical protein